MTCENQVAIDLFAVSHVIDVRLLKILVFGKNAAAATPPFTLADRSSYHIKEWVAKALWDADGHARQLPLSDEHRRPRWRIKLNGKLLRDPKAEISHSFAEPGIAHMVRGAFSGWIRPLFRFTSLVLRVSLPFLFNKFQPNGQARQGAVLWQDPNHQIAHRTVYWRMHTRALHLPRYIYKNHGCRDHSRFKWWDIVLLCTPAGVIKTLGTKTISEATRFFISSRA
jgi:hypothetical protein